VTREDPTSLQLPLPGSQRILQIKQIPIVLLSLWLLLLLIPLSVSIVAFAGHISESAVIASLHQKPSIKQSISSPTPRSTPAPMPAPIEPFPQTLAAQIATLKAHDRLFYQGNANLPEIALTFDDGPNPTFTPQILAILKRYHVQATFFDIGRLVELYPDLVRQEIAGGHIVGNHTWSHPYLPGLSLNAIKTQISQTSAIIQQVTGTRPLLLRPPYGSISSATLTAINSFGMTTVIWNDEAQDWSLPGTSVIVSRILQLAGNGAIILLHDGGGNRFQTVAALPAIIEQLRARHYRFVTMAQLVADAHLPKPPDVKATPTPVPSRNHPQATPVLWQKQQERMVVRPPSPRAEHRG